MKPDGGHRATTNESLELDEDRRASVAGCGVAQRPAHAGHTEERRQHERDEQCKADALRAPFLLLKFEVLVDFEVATFLHHETFALSHRSIGSSTRTSTPRAADTMTRGQRARPHAMPMAEASQIDAAVVRPRTDSSVCPRMIVPAPRNPTPVTIP